MGVIKPELSTAPLTLPTSRHELPSTGVSSVFGDHSEKTEESILDFLKITPTGSFPNRIVLEFRVHSDTLNSIPRNASESF